MSLFLTVVPVSKAIAVVKSLARTAGDEHVPLEHAWGRILADDIRADGDIPGFDRSVVDGFAVRASDTTGAGEAIPSILRSRGKVEMGRGDKVQIRTGECVYVPTGGVLPKGADAVVMVENSEEVGDEILIKKPVAHGENVLLHNEGRVCVCDLEAAVSVKQPTVSHHLRLLRGAGLVTSERDGLWAYYRVRRDALAALRARIEGGLEGLDRGQASGVRGR